MSSTALSLIQAIQANGGHITLNGPWLVIKPRAVGAPIAEELRQHKAEIIALLERQPFLEWFNANVLLDEEAVVLCVPNPRYCAGLAALHRHYCDWAARQHVVPVTREPFRRLLEELCFEILIVHGEPLVPNVALKEDVEAQRRFDENRQEATVPADHQKKQPQKARQA